MSKVVGVGLSRLLGWKIDLRNPQLEVKLLSYYLMLSYLIPQSIFFYSFLQINVYLSDDHCLLGIPITRFVTEGLSLHVTFITADCMTSSRMRHRASLSDKHSEGMALLSLFRLPLANRCYIQTTGLRSTVAWAMASLAQIQVLTNLSMWLPAAALIIFEETAILPYMCDLFMFANQKAL